MKFNNKDVFIVIDGKFYIKPSSKIRIGIAYYYQNYRKRDDSDHESGQTHYFITEEDLQRLTNGKYKADKRADSALEEYPGRRLTLDIDTSEVINMNAMFNGCENLSKLDITKLDTSNVTDISNMFMSCRSLEILDLSNFDTSKVTDVSYMFVRCPLKKLKVGKKWTKRITKDGNEGYLNTSCVIYAEPTDVERIKGLFPNNTVKTWNEWNE